MFGPINEFRRRLGAGETLIGTGVNLSDSQASEALAPSVDFLWVDLEHAAMSEEALKGHLLAARYKRTPVVVRVVQSTTPFVKPVLDAGAPGVIAPQVRSADEVRAFVADCRYPPQGRRGFGPLVPSDYGRKGDEYVQEANAGVFAAVMIEHVDAVEAIDDIVTIPGLDSIVFGPMDLSGSLGRLGDVDHPDVVAALEKCIAAAQKAGVFIGSGLGTDPAFAETLAKRGVQWLQVGGDIGLLIWGVEKLWGDIRERLG